MLRSLTEGGTATLSPAEARGCEVTGTTRDGVWRIERGGLAYSVCHKHLPRIAPISRKLLEPYSASSFVSFEQFVAKLSA